MATIELLGSAIHYREMGSGVPFVFLHGNPASSYVWRNVLPKIGDPARRLAPDLIGMGESGKPELAYSFADHARYLDAWFDALDLESVVLVGHDWGGALAFDWAARHPDRVRGIAFMETILRPFTWDDFPGAGRPRYEALRAPGTGETKVLDENFFIEVALRSTTTALDPADQEVYRSYYPTRESRHPLLAWPRAMPIAGEPAEVVARVNAYGEWLAASAEVPKLLIACDGPAETLMVGPAMTAWCRDTLPNLEIASCGPAKHIAPEDQPDAIAAAIASWANRHNLR